MVIDGAAVAAALRRRAAEVTARLRSEIAAAPGLATVLVGNDPASQVYVRAKGRACAAADIGAFDIRLPSDISEAGLAAEIEKLNHDDRIDGVLVQLPLPRQIDPHRMLGRIDPAKDVDGFHPVNVGRLWSGLPTMVPCTPQGCLRLLRTVHPDLAGLDAKPLADHLTKARLVPLARRHRPQHEFHDARGIDRDLGPLARCPGVELDRGGDADTAAAAASARLGSARLEPCPVAQFGRAAQ